ncbi:MAG: PilZ domain-containing protein [Sphingomonadales bacterium]|nr:PilZ domain-containing protein [Sphingomonadales bacterium]MDE2569420.1 PilZ domain-containing protein [Sphingomonadales bacterium]
MRYFQGSDEVLQIERRANTRVLTYCAAELRTPAGCRSGQLTNISVGGARLQLRDPPRAGTTVILEWKSFHSFCKVVWSRDDACGLAFEKPLAQGDVAETTGQADAPPNPEADLRSVAVKSKLHAGAPGPGIALGNIPSGTPRGWARIRPGQG